jgi:dipeptide/tripeptide permease
VKVNSAYDPSPDELSIETTPLEDDSPENLPVVETDENGSTFVFTHEEVDNLASVFRLLPILACYIAFHIIYNQMQSSYYTQGMYLNLQLGSLRLPVSILNIFNSLTIVTLIPILDRVVYPGKLFFFFVISHYVNC